MTQSYKAYVWQRQTVGVRHHEGGHAAIARSHNRLIRVRARILTAETGRTKIQFPDGTAHSVKYEVSVAGCLAEAKVLSKRQIDTTPENVAVVAAQIVNCLNEGRRGFPVDVPVSGNAIQQAGGNSHDFKWLKGGPPDRNAIAAAIIQVGQKLEDASVWNEVDFIARFLLQAEEYDSKYDV